MTTEIPSKGILGINGKQAQYKEFLNLFNTQILATVCQALHLTMEK